MKMSLGIQSHLVGRGGGGESEVPLGEAKEEFLFLLLLHGPCAGCCRVLQVNLFDIRERSRRFSCLLGSTSTPLHLDIGPAPTHGHIEFMEWHVTFSLGFVHEARAEGESKIHLSCYTHKDIMV